MRFTRFVRELAGDARQVMEVGCGTGEQIASLALAMPQASFTGVDTAATNIEAASAKCAAMSLSPRVHLVAGDYLEFSPTTRFDLIVSYSTLQLIPGPSVQLFAKIAAELEPRGLLINAMPYECGYNRMLMRARHVFRLLRSGPTDAIVLGLGRLLHHRDLNPDMLRQRVEYMYQIPSRLDGDALRALMREQCGLEFVAQRDEPHASIAQAKHRLAVFRKSGSRP